MTKVKLRQVMITIPVEASGDDYDIEIQASLYATMQAAAKAMQRVSDACNEAVTQQLLGMTGEEGDSITIAEHTRLAAAPSSPAPPVTQDDPVINTRVSDDDMDADDDMTLAEFRAKPVRTRPRGRPQ